MKIFKIYKTAIIAGALSLGSCAHEDQPKKSQLDFTPPPKMELDDWIEANFLNPFNINVYYKWNQNLVDDNRYLYPPMVNKVQPAMQVVKKIWFDSYSTIGGKDFVKKIAPREFVLVGGQNLNQDGTVTLGLAESGQKVSLFEVDKLNRRNRSSITNFIHTLQHEYVHILNQTKPFDEQAWAKLTPSGYTSSWYVEPISTSRSLGFITSYARLNIYEDFAETAATILTSSKAEYNAILESIAEDDGKAKIKAKEALVVKYYKDAFNIDFYALRDEAQKNTDAIINN